MTEKTLQELQEEHSALCARAIDLKVKVPEDLTVDFDTAEAGRAVCASLAKLVENAEALAKDSGAEHNAPVQKTKKVSAKKAVTKPAAGAAKQQESKMAKTAKKKAPAKKATKTAKKATAKKAAAGKPRGDTKVSKVIAKLKNGGITRAEILKMTGWKAVSVQQLAKAAGIKLKISEERPFVYRAAK